MSRGPSGSNVIWEFTAESGLDVGVWGRLQNQDTTTAGNSLIANWPNGSGSRTTLPAASGFDGVGKAVRFELRQGDIGAGTGERTELSGDGQSWQFREGDERWIQMRVKFASNWTPGTAGRFNIITQFHSGAGSPPLSIQVRDDGALMLEDAGTAGDANAAAGIGWKTILTAAEWTAKKGQWIDLNLHVKWSNSRTVGFAEVHVDGVLKVAKHSRQTMASDRCYMKIGMYRHSQAQTNVIWFDDLRLTSGTQVGGSDPDPGSGGGGTGTITVLDGATQVYELDDASGPATNWTIPRPTTGGALAQNDLLVAAISWDTPNTTMPSRTLPSGWSVLVPQSLQGTGTTTVASEAIYHFVTAGEAATPPAGWLMTMGAAIDGTVSVGRFRGVDPADPFAITGGANYVQQVHATAVAAKVAPAVTTDAADAVLITGATHRSGSQALAAGSPSTGYTLLASAWGVGGRASGLAYKSQAATGASGTATWTQATGTGVGQAWQTALKPAAASSGVVAPVVEAGANASVTVGQTFVRAASENDGGATITARSWTVVSGPGGGATGSLGTTATLSWAPTAADVGTFVLRYSATNSAGTTTDDITVQVNSAGTATVTLAHSSKTALAWSSTPTYTSVSHTFTAATAGQFLTASFSVNGDAGVFTPPAGWTVLAQRDVVGVGALICYKIAAGGETSVSASWTIASEQASAVVTAHNGVHQTNPLGPNNFPAFVDAAVTSITLDPTPAVVNGAALAFVATGAAGTAGEFEPASSGWTLLQSAYDSSNASSSGMAVLHDLSVVSGEDLNSTFTWTRAARVIGFITLLNAAGATIPDEPPPPPDEEEPPPPTGTSPILRSRQVGFPEVGLGRVSANVGSAVRARLKVGTDPAVTASVVYGPYATPNAQGDIKMTVGLPATYTSGKYYYRVAMVNSEGGEWLDTASQVGIIKTAPTGRVGLTFSFGSCCFNADTASALAIANRNDDVCAIHGDFWYADNSGTGVSNYRAKMDSRLRATNIGRMIATTPFIYTPSDHDYGMVDDGIGPGTGGTSFNQVFREKISSPALPGSTGVYWSKPWGTAIRFIVLDTRSFGVIGSTKLGATQKQWFKDTVTNATEDLLIVVQDGVWIGGADATSDDWQGVISERNELGDFIAASGKNVVMIGGDMHAIAADNGSNTRGGFPLYHAAPLNNQTSIKGGPYSAGTYPTSGSSTFLQQYGRIVVTLGADTITSQFTGYSSDNTVRKTMTNTFTAAPAPEETGRIHDVWNGSNLSTRTAERWNGSALVPVVNE